MAENGEINVGCFLEDIAQERFITALVRKVANSVGVPNSLLRFDIRNATGGRGRVLSSLSEFLDHWVSGRQDPRDVLLVTLDGNCEGYLSRRNRVEQMVHQKGYPGRVVCAVPNLHIEKWYLADPQGFQSHFSSPRLPVIPRYKCERARYKRALADALLVAGVDAPLGGAEYGEEIAQHMEFLRAERNDRSLRSFINNLRSVFQTLHRSK